jgi:arylsulfatase
MRTISTFLILLLAGCGGTREFSAKDLRDHTEGMNVLLVILDAANPHHFSFMGYERETTPNLDRMAAEAVVFSSAYAQASATPLSMYSLMTSRYPILDEDQYPRTGELAAIIPAAMPTLATWATEKFPERAAFLANNWMREELGFHHGYSTFEKVYDEVPGGTIASADLVSDRFTAWLDTEPSGPWLGWMHYLEPHTPYSPPEPWYSMFDPGVRGLTDGSEASMAAYRESVPDGEYQRNVVALYDGNLAWVDHQFGRVVDDLKRRGEWDRTIVIVTSDHGEAFWEHGVRGHGTHVYDEFVRIPLVIRVPGLAPRRVDPVVELIDVTPTILDLAGVFVPAGSTAGQSLVGLMTGSAKNSDTAHFRNHKSGFIELGVRRGPMKFHEYVVENRFELFDVGRDSAEQKNLLVDPGDRPDAIQTLAEGMQQLLGTWVERGDGVGGDLSPSALVADSLDADTIEALRAIGYFGGN